MSVQSANREHSLDDMYRAHFGFRDKPFKLVHDPACYYAPAHQAPLNELCYVIEEHQGLATLVGEPGTGKTTLLQRLLQSFSSHLCGVFLSDMSLGGQSLLRELAHGLGVSVADSEKGLLRTLRKHLHQEVLAGKTIVLLVDEAQGLTIEQFEEVRYLSNLEIPGRKLVETILAGQPTLEDRLALPEHAALRQRVTVRSYIEPLDLQHTAAYIEHRLLVAGAKDPRMFTADALRLIHEKSGGIPRLINVICERALLMGYLADALFIDRAKVEDAVGDLRLEPSQSAAATAARPITPASDVLLAPLGARLDAIEQKLDVVLQALGKLGAIRPELAVKRSEPPSAETADATAQRLWPPKKA